MLEFLGQRSLDCLVGWSEGGVAAVEGGFPAEVAVVVGPDAGADTAPEVQQGAAFPSYAGLEEQQEAAEALQAALQAAAAEAVPDAEQQQLGVGAGPAQEDMPGLVAGGLIWRHAVMHCSKSYRCIVDGSMLTCKLCKSCCLADAVVCMCRARQVCGDQPHGQAPLGTDKTHTQSCPPCLSTLQSSCSAAAPPPWRQPPSCCRRHSRARCRWRAAGTTRLRRWW